MKNLKPKLTSAATKAAPYAVGTLLIAAIAVPYSIALHKMNVDYREFLDDLRELALQQGVTVTEEALNIATK